MPANINEIEKRLWSAADELRANSKLKSSEYSVPVLGLIFLGYADHKFSEAEEELKGPRRVPFSLGDSLGLFLWCKTEETFIELFSLD